MPDVADVPLAHIRLWLRYRLVIIEMKAMVGLLHLADFVMYAPREADASDDFVPLHRKEAAQVTMKLKVREGEGGVLRPSSYMVLPQGSGEQQSAAPKAWVFEGLTSEYA